MSFHPLKALRHNLASIGRTKKIRSGSEQDVIVTKDSSFHVKEAYKVLRTNLIFSLPVEGCKKIIITSALPSEGKSTTSLNLALSFAETGVRVLLIDADLRRPNISPLLGQKASPGLSNLLVQLSTLDEVIRPSGHDNLDVIFSGDIPPNPAELLGSDAMRDILERLSDRYDYILLDTCPVNLVADTSILTKFVSGVALVVQRNQSEKDVTKEAVEQLQFVGAKILGIILNRMEYSQKGYSRYGRNNYYKYGYFRYGQEYDNYYQ